jgi:hypothetical protein
MFLQHIDVTGYRTFCIASLISNKKGVKVVHLNTGRSVALLHLTLCCLHSCSTTVDNLDYCRTQRKCEVNGTKVLPIHYLTCFE